MPQKALLHNPDLLRIIPVSPTRHVRGREDFDLGSELMVGHKVGLSTDAEIPSDGLRRKDTTKAQLLILDDWGPDRLNTSQRRDLMEIVEDRYQAGSTIITSQLPVSTWHDVIGEPTFADAILDRLVHNAYRLELEGQSFRKNTAKTGDDTSPE